MLIHLEASLIDEIINKNGIESTASVALQNIAQARAQGDHIVTAEPDLLEVLIGLDGIGANTKGIFRRIATEQSQIGALRHKLSVYISIKALNGAEYSENYPIQKILRIPLARFQRNDITQPTFLIAENLLDCELLVDFSSWFSKNYRNGVIPSKLKATLFPGGGDTTDRALLHLVREQRYLTLGITDSDQKYPSASKGQTTLKCSRVTLSEIADHQTLPVKSIENLLSFDQILAILETKHSRHIWKNNLERLRHLSGTEAWKYFPFKDGVPELHGPCKSGSLVAYWRGNIDLKSHPMDDDFIFNQMSSKLLQWSVDHFKDASPVCIKSDAILFEIWEKLALLIASWTCASEPIRA